MKKHKKTLTVLSAFIALAVIATALLTAASPVSKPEEKDQRQVEPLVIINTDDKNGKVTIYQDGELVYGYEGPIDVRRKNGKYLIEIHTDTCSCFREEGEDTTNNSEVEE